MVMGFLVGILGGRGVCGFRGVLGTRGIGKAGTCRFIIASRASFW
jgi:hypothetical protein